MARCLSSTAIPTSMPPLECAKNADGQFTKLLTTATSSAASSAARSSTTRRSSSSAMPGCGRWWASSSGAAVMPTADERLGDFTADTFKVYMPGTETTSAGRRNQHFSQLPGRYTELHSAEPAGSDRGHHPDGQISQCGDSAAQRAEQNYVGFFTGPTNDNEYLGKVRPGARQTRTTWR